MAREIAVQLLYQVDLGDSDAPDAVRAFDLVEYLRQPRVAEDPEEEDASAVPEVAIEPDLELGRAAFEQAQQMVVGAREHLEELDGRIAIQAENWRIERMPAVDRNILRLAAWEMLYEPDVPPLVVLDEAVELAKRFGSENSSRFVNGLLDGLMKAITAEAPGA
jgi:N utilization substance protein B